MRRGRLLDTDSGGPAPRHFLVAAWTAAIAGFAAAIAGALGHEGAVPVDAAVFALCLLAPLPPLAGDVRMRRFLGFQPPPRAVFTLLSAACVLVLGVRDAAYVLPALLTALQGHLLCGLGDDRTAAWSPPCSLVLALSGLVTTATVLGALLVPVALAASLAAQLLLTARSTRSAVASRSIGGTLAGETRDGLRRRWIYAAPLAFVLLVVALVAAPFARTAPWRLLDGSGRRADGTRPPPAENRGAPIEDGSGGASFRDEISVGAIPLPAYEVLMEVVPRDGEELLGDIGPILLRGIVLSEVTARGARMRDTRLPTRRRDAEDGTLDGWVRLRPVSADGETISLELSHYPLPIEPEGWSLLFSVEPLAAVSLDDVRYDPDRLLVASEAPEGWFTYVVRVPRPDSRIGGLPRARAEHPDGRYVQLPADSPELRRVAEEGRQITSGATHDADRVGKIARHFATDFEYSLEETAEPGIAGLVEFLDRRSGYCSQYALAAVVMLRSQGIPARMVTGFLVNEWSDDEQAYQVRPRDTHAWFEVHFDGLGWLAFDATPPDRRREALDRAAAADESGAAAWARSVLDHVGAMVRGQGGEEVAFRDLLAVLRSAPAAVRNLALVLVALSAVLILLFQVRRALPGRGPAVPRARREIEDLYGRILAALARRGHRKHPAQTPREFAQATAHAGGVAYRALLSITEDLYAARFGGRPLDAAARERIRAFMSALR